MGFVAACLKTWLMSVKTVDTDSGAVKHTDRLKFAKFIKEDISQQP